MTDDERDEESMKEELAEVEAKDEALRDKAPGLATALKMAHRLLLSLPASHEAGSYDGWEAFRYEWRQSWPTIDAAVEWLNENYDR